MAECLTCKKQYHACSSCGMQDWEYTWCNEECRSVSEHVIGLPLIMRKIFTALTPEERQVLSDAFWDRGDNETLFTDSFRLLKFCKEERDFK